MEMLQYVARWLPKPWSGLGDLAPPFDGTWQRAAAGWVVRADRLLGKLAIAALLVAIVHYALTLAHARAALADFHPLNGDFQNYNPVRRMFLGEQVGRDFDSYLGLGPVCLLYATMLPLGSDFTTSLFATHFLHAIATAGAILLLCRLCGVLLGWSCLVGWFALVYARSPAFLPAPAFLHECFMELAYPSNSSQGVRCLAPLLAAPALVCVIRRCRDVRISGLCLGAIAGTLLLWSNDFGLPTATSLLLFGCAWLYWRAETRLRAISAAALMLLATGLSAFLVLLAVTGSPREWFAYNFLNVVKDQFWFVIDPTSKITTIFDIPVYRGVPLAFACLGLLAWKARRSGFRAEDLSLAMLLVANVLAGYVTCSGSRGERYFFPLYRCLAVIVPYLAWSWISLVLRKPRMPALREVFARRGWQLAAATAGALAVCTLLAARTSYQDRTQREAAAAATLEVPELGGRLGHQFSKVVAVGREIRARAIEAEVPARQRLFSTYASAMDAVAGAVHPSRSDYIIHALGPQRRNDYLHVLASAQPMFVTTIRDDFTPWERWLRTVHWDFYAQLLKDYRPVDRTLYNIVWQRRSEPADWPDITLPATTAQVAENEVQLAVGFPPEAMSGADQRHFVEVEIDYHWQWKPFPTVRGGLRPYLFAQDEARPDGWGLPPYQTTYRFPLELAPGETRLVKLVCLPPDMTQLSVSRSTARVLLPKSEVDGFALSRLRASSLCDDSWRQGIWVRDARAGFFVADYTDLATVRPGSRLRFRASGERVVERMAADQVWLSGAPLNPAEDGYPHPIEIVTR
jgi:hypothetical protein